MENYLISLAAPISTLIVALVGLMIAQKLGIGPKQQELIGTLQDLIAAQKIKIELFTTDTEELRKEIGALRQEIQELKETIITQAKDITKLTENRVTRRRKTIVSENEVHMSEGER